MRDRRHSLEDSIPVTSGSGERVRVGEGADEPQGISAGKVPPFHTRLTHGHFPDWSPPFLVNSEVMAYSSRDL